MGIAARPLAAPGSFLSLTGVCRNGENGGRGARGGAAPVDDATGDLLAPRKTKDAKAPSKRRPVDCSQNIAKRMRCGCIGNTSRERAPLLPMPMCLLGHYISSWEIRRMGCATFIMRWKFSPPFEEPIPMRESWRG